MPFVAVYTFYLGWRQKENERRFDFYNVAVISPAVEDLNKFFEKYLPKLAEEARRANDSSEPSTPRASTEFITEFATDLYALKDTLFHRLEVFDEHAARRVQNTVEELDTKITQWLVLPKPKEAEDARKMLVSAKGSLMRILFTGRYGILGWRSQS